MIIYLVSGDEYEQRYIAAAFTSKEEAEKFVNEENPKRASPYNVVRGIRDDFYHLAEEVELKGMPVIL